MESTLKTHSIPNVARTNEASHAGEQPLTQLNGGEIGIILDITTSKDIRLKLLEMGVGKGETVRFIRRAPFGDPIEIEVMDSRIAIRSSEAESIVVKKIR